MGIVEADRLQQIIERANGWPIWSADHAGGVGTGTYSQVGGFGKSMRDIALWVAMRESDRSQLIELTNWERDRVMHVDPLPERISVGFSDLLFGDEPDFFAGDDADQHIMDDIVEENDLSSELKRWADMAVSEGECWWRVWTDRDACDYPLIDAYSRLNVIPLFVGRKIVAAAFTDDILTQELKVENEVHVVFWRHIEIQTVGYVRNLLYRGTVGGLGDSISLKELPETQDLPSEWNHQLPVMLAGRVPNKLGRDFKLGVSDYNGIRDILMDLNESRTIMAENARLVLKARMVVPASAVGPDGNFDAGKDVILAESLDEEMAGNAKSGPYAVLEYNFPSDKLLSYQKELTVDALARVGLAEQFVQETRGGSQAYTGTALRTRLIPTTLSASGKGRRWDGEVPNMLKAMALVSQLPIERGGTGQDWSDPHAVPNMKRASVLPEDENEETQRHVMAVQGEIESIQTAVTALHPDWDEDQVKEEIQRINADRSVGATFGVEDQTGKFTLDIPNVPGARPEGSVVPTPGSIGGTRQPGAGRIVDGQSPGKQAPEVVAGGPK